jgi:hypothetical protein
MGDAPERPISSPRNEHLVALARGAAGAILGAAAGVLLFVALGWFGIYAIAAIGALTGLGCGYLSQRRSIVLAIVSLAVALVVTFLNEWWNNYFTDDPSLSFFIQNLSKANRILWLSLVLGGGLAFWFGLGSDRTPRRSAP